MAPLRRRRVRRVRVRVPVPSFLIIMVFLTPAMRRDSFESQEGGKTIFQTWTTGGEMALEEDRPRVPFWTHDAISFAAQGDRINDGKRLEQ